MGVGSFVKTHCQRVGGVKAGAGAPVIGLLLRRERVGFVAAVECRPSRQASGREERRLHGLPAWDEEEVQVFFGSWGSPV